MILSAIIQASAGLPVAHLDPASHEKPINAHLDINQHAHLGAAAEHPTNANNAYHTRRLQESTDAPAGGADLDKLGVAAATSDGIGIIFDAVAAFQPPPDEVDCEAVDTYYMTPP